MNKAELVNFMSDKSGKSKAECERSLNLVMESIIEALSKESYINLVGFGSFHVKQRKAHEGRNPQTGKKMHISAYKQPIFRVGKKMKMACN